MRGYAAVGVDNPKNPYNIGSVLRAGGCYRVSMLAFSGPRPKKLKSLGRIPSDTHKAHKHIPTFWCDDLYEVIPFGCVPVAVDLTDDARSIIDYVHPERAFYIFGAEDATLGTRITSWCRDVIYVPTNYCMNVAAAANVVLYDRMLKQMRSK